MVTRPVFRRPPSNKLSRYAPAQPSDLRCAVMAFACVSVLDLVAFSSGLAVRHPLKGWRAGELTCSPLFATTPGELASAALSITSSDNWHAARQFATSTG